MNSNLITVKKDNNQTTWLIELKQNNETKIISPLQESSMQIQIDKLVEPELPVKSNVHSNIIVKENQPTIPTKETNDLFCIVCQNENIDDLIKCSNSKCTTSYCKKCLTKLIKSEKSRKCPNCPFLFKLEFGDSKLTIKGFSGGTLKYNIQDGPLKGYGENKTIEFHYSCKSGIQKVSFFKVNATKKFILFVFFCIFKGRRSKTRDSISWN